jgi:ferredoxin-NADP reductase
VYAPGQFLVVSFLVDGKVEKRPYSFSSPPHWDNVELIVKLHPHGKVSPLMHELVVGDSVDLVMPYGLFTIKKPYPPKLVFFAFNQALSAVLGILRHLEYEHYEGDITLLYANPKRDDIVYPGELERLSRSLCMRVHHIMWDEHEHIDEERILAHCDIRGSVFYLHGNPTVVGQWQVALGHVGVTNDNVCLDTW